MNSKQRIILAIVVPAILLVIAWGIADESYGGEKFGVWAVALALVGLIEYKLFGDKKK